MLVNEFGEPLPPLYDKPHWRVLKALLAHPALEAPLRAAAEAHINTVLTAHPTAAPSTIRISSKKAGPPVLGRLPADWSGDYKRWLDDLRHRHPDLPLVDDGQIHGLLFWHHFAAVRPERWRVSTEDGERFYTLLDSRPV
jgi:hypothetical protein